MKYWNAIIKTKHEVYDPGDNEPYGNRGHYNDNSSFVGLKESHNYGECSTPDSLDDCKTLWAVAVKYSTGDTFGRDDGQMTLAAVVQSYEEAANIAKAIRSDYDWAYENRWAAKADKPKHRTYKEFSEEYKRLGYTFNYECWSGYFECLEEVYVEEVAIHANMGKQRVF